MDTSPYANPPAPLLVDELRERLISSGITHGVNLRLVQTDEGALVHIMAVSIGNLGMLLVMLTDQAELGDLTSLSCRVTPGDAGGGTRPAGNTELNAGRYPGDKAVVFSFLKIRLPISDLTEAVRRLRERH